MRIVGDSLILSPTDLSGFLGCRHRTGLDLAVAHGALERPVDADPFAAMLQRLGEEHERRYVESLRRSGLNVVDLGQDAEAPRATNADLMARTMAAMRQGVDVIVQARLERGGVGGYADVLRRVEAPSALGAWSYEAQDTKLARETKGGTILQLSAYSALLTELQGRMPEHFQVVTPDPVAPVQTYRVDDYAAYYRMVLDALRAAARQGHETLVADHYPEPVDACGVCRWEARCIGRRRADDHSSFIANAGRAHRVELTTQGYPTLAATAAMPVPVAFKPARGARQTYDRIGHQARVQHQQRQERRPIHEVLPIVAGEGLSRLPEPSPGDLFLDLEGARFAREEGREYLFGLWGQIGGGPPHGLPLSGYMALWATNDAEEQAAFEQVMDIITAAWMRDPGMHVYHFNHYEPTAFKKLMGRYATRGDALDQLLRAGRFVDLYPITRQAVRAGVESYSIKKLEPFTGYTRTVSLAAVNHALMTTELALESGAAATLTAEIRGLVAGYNQDDCRSTEALRDWLESLRREAIAGGTDVPRPESKTGDPSAKVSDLQGRAAALRARLLDGLSEGGRDPAHPDHPRWLLAYLVDFHKREENAEWAEFFRLLDVPEDDLLDERRALTGLEHIQQIDVVKNKRTGKPTRSIIHRYRYPNQDADIRANGSLKLRNQQRFGSVDAQERAARTIDIKQGEETAAIHPDTVFSADVIPTTVLQEAVMRFAGQMTEGCGMDLLQRRRPRLRAGTFEPAPDETPAAFALRVVATLDNTTLAVQGPPGAGKTHTGAQMIRLLVSRGKRVGVAANSHKVIRNLLDEVRDQARGAGEKVRLGHKAGDDGGDADVEDDVRAFTDNDTPLDALRGGEIDVLGGTAYLWAREEYAGSVDVLFVDEAGQMSLGNVLAMSHATADLVLLGDPQQLEQPMKASHPEGVGISALQHVLGDHETMPADRGLFLPTTWRMSPALCAFTSELFYEGKLQPKPGLGRQVLRGTRDLDGSQLWLQEVTHDGNQSASDEEVDAVEKLVDRLLQPGAQWVDEHGVTHALMARDIRIVAPFNAQVNRLSDRLGARGVPIGTVDKFQGQTAAVVIYSMTTSRSEDAPRGMEFLFSLNRLNVATSRARCAVILVASPRLFEPECRTPKQMQLANALCRYREMATIVRVEARAV